MAGERGGHSLQATALVNEAYLRLIDVQHVDWQNRAHFLAMSARLMRRILVDVARSKRYQKRGGGAVRVTFDDALVVTHEPGQDLVALDDALEGVGDGGRAQGAGDRASILRRAQRRGDRFGLDGVGGHGDARLEAREGVAAAELRDPGHEEGRRKRGDVMRADRGRGMTTDRWRRIEALYHEMLARPAHERAAALGVACAGDAALQAEVQSLLDQPESAAGFLATPAMDLAAQPGLARERAAHRAAHRRLRGAGAVGRRRDGRSVRARDSRLGREVAIKILPRAFKDDPDRLARFEREAQLLASLNHPHIGAIYGLEDADGVTRPRDGARRGRGSVAAHRARGDPDRRGTADRPADRRSRSKRRTSKASSIRDLKPANIKVRRDGTVKVLDFGLAKALAPASGDAPTLTAVGDQAASSWGLPRI